MDKRSASTKYHMLKFENLSLRRGTRELFTDVSITINNGQKVGITGANGVGKSSLFALIRNELHADSGELIQSGISTIAHVSQDIPTSESTALDYILDGDLELRNIEQNIKTAQSKNDGHTLADYYSDLENIDGYRAASRAATILYGLGFTAEQESSRVNTFSGGWRMRLNLAQALMCRSDLLLLDEPTNHLDLDAVLWLEEWLRAYAGTLLLISHDRDFLDNIINHIAYVEHKNVRLYTGNYSSFEVQRSQDLAVQQASYEKQQLEISRIHKFVDKFKAKATKAKQAQSRIKALERMEVISKAHIDSPFTFRFKISEKNPSQLVSLDGVAAGYVLDGQNNTVLEEVNLTINSGARIGLLGPNGAGKSTLIKLLAAEIQPQCGEVSRSRETKVGYFAQHQLEYLDQEASPLVLAQRLDARATENDLRKYLGGFAFHEDMAIDPVKTLSGGEKARLALALIVYQQPNLLLMDEPTNHLDLEMRHALTVALQSYEGAMVVVSHDRHLLRTTTDQLILVENKRVNDYDGDLDNYAKWLQQIRNQKKEIEVIGDEQALTSKKQLRQQAANQRKYAQPLRNRLKKIEQKMEKLNSKKEKFEAQLSDSSLYSNDNKDTLKQLLLDQNMLQSELDEIELTWFEVSEELEKLNKTED